jgi:hypothetical protein
MKVIPAYLMKVIPDVMPTKFDLYLFITITEFIPLLEDF